MEDGVADVRGTNKGGPPRIKRKTLGSSSGSDIAVHEGADLSDDEQGE